MKRYFESKKRSNYVGDMSRSRWKDSFELAENKNESNEIYIKIGEKIMFKRVIELWENNVFIQRGRYGLPPLQLQKSSILWGQRWISVSFLNVLFLSIHYTKKAQQQTSITAHAQPCAVKLVTRQAFVRPWIWLWITSSLSVWAWCSLRKRKFGANWKLILSTLTLFHILRHSCIEN